MTRQPTPYHLFGKKCIPDFYIGRGLLEGGRFQMPGTGEGHVTGGNGWNSSGRKVLIFFG
jgi:hypothetical protein